MMELTDTQRLYRTAKYRSDDAWDAVVAYGGKEQYDQWHAATDLMSRRVRAVLEEIAGKDQRYVG